MKISTTIRPRRDGTVTFQHGKVTYTFREDDRGDLVCEVPDEEAVTKMLLTDNFAPADPADYDRATVLVGGAADVGGDGEGDDDPDDDPIDPNAAPIEANTPPAPAPAPAPAADPAPGGEPSPAGAPIEANTPPASFKPKPKRAA